MKIFLLIRRTQKYHETGELDLGYMVPDHKKILDAIAGWNFAVRYLDFRRELRKISEMSWGTNDFDGIIPWSDRKSWLELPENSWLVPMDEDDWLAPHFVKTLRRVVTGKDCPQITWDVLRKSADGSPRVNDFKESCGYALKLPCSWDKVTNHMTIRPEGKYLPTTLALRNETVASLGFMMYQNATDRLGTLKKAIGAPPAGMPECFTRQYEAYQDLLKRALPASTAASGTIVQD